MIIHTESFFYFLPSLIYYSNLSTIYRYPINVPHPEPLAFPQFVQVMIPQPYPSYTHVKHKIEIPVYKIIPEIIEKPIPYTVEKPYPGDLELITSYRTIYFILKFIFSAC